MRNHAKTFFAGARKPVIMNKCGKKGVSGYTEKGVQYSRGLGRGVRLNVHCKWWLEEVEGVH